MEVPPDQAAKEQPNKTDKFSNRPALAANPNPPDTPATQPRNASEQPDLASLNTSPPAPPKLPAPPPAAQTAEAAQPQPPAQPNRPAPPDPGKAGLNETLATATPPQPALPKTTATNPAEPKKLALANRPTLPDIPLPNVKLPTEAAINPLLQNAKRRLADSRRPAGGSFSPPPILQPGGVARNGRFNMDIEMPLHGEYDERMINAIALRWIDLNLQAKVLASYHVVLVFEQTDKGAIEHMRVVSVNFKKPTEPSPQDIPVYLCSSAITGLSPFKQWPAAMRRELGADRRRCRFTFIFNIIPR